MATSQRHRLFKLYSQLDDLRSSAASIRAQCSELLEQKHVEEADRLCGIANRLISSVMHAADSCPQDAPLPVQKGTRPRPTV